MFPVAVSWTLFKGKNSIMCSEQYLGKSGPNHALNRFIIGMASHQFPT